MFVAAGRTITFHGFLRAYVEAVDEFEEGQSDDAQTRLPTLTRGQPLRPESVTASGHETRPPGRYTEPSLVAKLEELEIGRPSTYASILKTITSRDYVFKKGSALVPTWLAFAVTRLLEEHFPKLVDYAFTAEMEEVLDQIADGHAERLKVLTDFYFGADDREGLQRLVSELGEIDARKLSTYPVGDPDSGIVVRVGRYGTYVEDEDGQRANLAEDLPPDELTVDLARELLSRPAGEERVLGVDPETGYTVVARNGRFGPYVTEQLPEDAPKNAKPKTGSLLSSMSLEDVSLEDALRLMSLPRVVGVDIDGVEITAQNGRYGPYLKKGSDSRSLDNEEQIFTITADEARQIYAQPKQRGRAAAKPPLKELGNDPASGRPMIIKDGRFGAYVTDGEVNATLRRGDDIESITGERAAALLAEKRAKGPAQEGRHPQGREEGRDQEGSACGRGGWSGRGPPGRPRPASGRKRPPTSATALAPRGTTRSGVGWLAREQGQGREGKAGQAREPRRARPSDRPVSNADHRPTDPASQQASGSTTCPTAPPRRS